MRINEATQTARMDAGIHYMAKALAERSPTSDTYVLPFNERYLLFEALLLYNKMSKTKFFPDGTKQPNIDLFYKIIAHYENKFKFVRYTPHSKCNDSFCLKKMMEIASTQKEYEVQRDAWLAHQMHQHDQRTVYYGKRLLSEMREILSLDIDAENQNVSTFPHLQLKALEGLPRLRMKLVAVLAHGHGSWVFAVPPDYAHGSSLTMTL